MGRFYNSVSAHLSGCIILFLLSFQLLTSCRNEENIHDLMGQWQLTEYRSEDGTSGPTTGFDWYISFQGSTAWVKEVNAKTHDYQSVFAACDIRSDSLIMEFTTRYGRSDTLLVEHIMNFPSFGHSPLGMNRIDDSTLLLHNSTRTWLWKRY